ncbi:AraC family transcriptional regulator [Acidovorax sp. LjRoot129]|uniref:helix-turn-helix domain-containing protein n=1 Tax=Acidovorax sp. LjRoot129 TaxID=3342260 RepID=UPI00121AD378|nr:MAG: AraC family transcriptional regulator [Acidovorax sp.]
MNLKPAQTGYVELPLGALDATRIEAVWRYDAMARGSQLVLPDGRMDLVVHCALHPDGSVATVWPVIAGPADQPALVNTRLATVIFGVRFHMGWGGACLGTSPGALRNRTAVGSEAAHILGPLALQPLVQARTAQGVEQALRCAARGLASRAAVAPAQGRALAAIERMVRQGHALEEGGGRWAGPSSRTLRRDMAAVAGLPLRTLAGILRFQRAMGLLQAADTSLGEVAAMAGYADQAHMTREFRRFGGFTPAMPTPAPVVQRTPCQR